ncbi:MAG: ubiquinone biosynthesis protein UbiB, partial [Brevundimonas sp.]|nr:ubiquinone biosynthesis protein UbiB [Brevundimonas sp.]
MGDLTSRLHPLVPPDAPVAQPVRDPLGAAARLIGWLLVLARHDALAPREITPILPAWARPI